MARLKFSRDYSHKLDDAGRTQTWPAGWEGTVDNEDVIKAATSATKDGEREIPPAAELVGKAPKPAAEVEIPADYEDYNAADAVNLAHQLGAGADVKTKADALKFIAAEAAKLNPPLV